MVDRAVKCVQDSVRSALEKAPVPLSIPGLDLAWGPPLPPRPRTAHGTFLRIVTVNDVYKLQNYPKLAGAVRAAKAAAASMGCVVVCTLSGDFLSPCIYSSLDGGVTMIEAMNAVGVDLVCLGNHEFDLGYDRLVARLNAFNGTVINSNAEAPALSHLPKTVTKDVGGRRVVFGGFVTDDLSIYSPTAPPQASHPLKSLAEVWASASRRPGSGSGSGNGGRARGPSLGPVTYPDLFVPLTHQTIEEDRDMAHAIAAAEATPGRASSMTAPDPRARSRVLTPAGERDLAGLAARCPVIIGGHEHEVYVDAAGKATIVKVGQDAEDLGFVDVWWTSQGKLQRRVTVVPANDWPSEPGTTALVDEKEAFLRRMMGTPITTLTEAMSSVEVRHGPSALASHLLQLMKLGLAHEGVEVAMSQGGSFRGNRAYPAGPFTMGDLFKEFAFDTDMAIIRLPGAVIADSVRNTRCAPKPAPQFLHLDEGAVVAADGEVVDLNGAPLDRDREYTVAVYQSLLTGLNEIQPLLSHVQANLRIPDVESCLPAKNIVMEACMKMAWRDLVNYGRAWDLNRDGIISRSELEAGIDRVIDEADTTRDGKIDSRELAAYFKAKRKGAGASSDLVEQMMKALDRNGDGLVDRMELKAIAF